MWSTRGNKMKKIKTMEELVEERKAVVEYARDNLVPLRQDPEANLVDDVCMITNLIHKLADNENYVEAAMYMMEELYPKDEWTRRTIAHAVVNLYPTLITAEQMDMMRDIAYSHDMTDAHSEE